MYIRSCSNQSEIYSSISAVNEGPRNHKCKSHLENLRNASRDLNHTKPSARQSYQAARDNYKKTIRFKKATFLQKALSSKNPREVWETLNPILDPPRNRIKHDPGELNRYYTELASTLTNKENITFDQSLLANIFPELEKDNTFTLKSTKYAEAKNIISELRNDYSSVFDNIPVKFLKLVAEETASPIVCIINSSIDEENLQDSRKVARVCPVPKIVNPIKEKDFRPISILLVLSKVYEKVISHQLNDYIEKPSVYNSTQSGFCKGHWT